MKSTLNHKKVWVYRPLLNISAKTRWLAEVSLIKMLRGNEWICDHTATVKDPWFVFTIGNVGGEVLTRACCGLSRERACRVFAEEGSVQRKR
jgi:hypothetical protein